MVYEAKEQRRFVPAFVRARWSFGTNQLSRVSRQTEQTLIGLKKEQRDKVEELKTKTGYYSTRNLLEKYDEVVKKNVGFLSFYQETRSVLTSIF